MAGYRIAVSGLTAHPFEIISENKRFAGTVPVTLGSTLWRAKCDTVQVAS